MFYERRLYIVFMLSRFLTNDMQFTTCTGHTSRDVGTCRLTNDMQFTICMTHNPLFHDPYDLYDS